VEFALREKRHAVEKPQRFKRGKESAECGVDGRHELLVFVDEILMVIESTHSREKDLPAHSQSGARGNDLDHLSELLAEPAVWKRHRQRWSVVKCRTDLLRSADGIVQDAIGCADQLQSGIECEHPLQ